MKYKSILISVSILVIILIIFFLMNTKFNWINTDIIEKRAVSSFNEVLSALPENIKKDEQKGIVSLISPDNKAQFIWTNNDQDNIYDAMIAIDVKPFLEAGLDISKLTNVDGITIDNDVLLLGINISKENFEYKNNLNTIDSFKQIINMNRKNLNYHSNLDHFGINLGNGNVFEWAQSIEENDKDIVFAINPEPFENAGVNLNAIDGWVYANVKTMDEKGKTIEVPKLLKPFNIK